ncbi:hypothetical protein LSAT2_018670, partial [Lamellibrachia satsuma]
CTCMHVYASSSHWLFKQPRRYLPGAIPARSRTGQEPYRPGAIPARSRTGQEPYRPRAIPARSHTGQEPYRPGAVPARSQTGPNLRGRPVETPDYQSPKSFVSTNDTGFDTLSSS